MNGSRPVPPPLNFPFRSRRKSYSSDIDERPGPSIFPAVTNTTSATSTRRVGYGYASSTSTSSSPVASSPPPSSSLRSLSYAHAYDVHIRRHSSPHHTHAFYAPTTEPFDHDIAWQNDLVNMDKPLLASPDPNHRAHLGHGARSSPFNGYPFAYQYAIPRSSSFAVSDESEDPPTTSDFDIPSGYSDDMDVDLGESRIPHNHFLSITSSPIFLLASIFCFPLAVLSVIFCDISNSATKSDQNTDALSTF